MFECVMILMVYTTCDVFLLFKCLCIDRLIIQFFSLPAKYVCKQKCLTCMNMKWNGMKWNSKTLIKLQFYFVEKVDFRK